MGKFKFTLLLIALLGAFSACNKDDDAAPPTKADMLAGKTWRLTAYTITPGVEIEEGQVISDLYTYIGSCIQDDFMTFTRNPNTYIVEEGATKCDPVSPQVSDTGSWLLNTDESTLVLASSTGQQKVYDIEELTATTLRYTYAIRPQGSNQVYTFSETYTAE